MTRRFIMVVTCALLASPRTPGAHAAAPADEAGVARQAPDAAALSEARLISAALNSVTGLTASFTQTVESAALPSPQVERGILYLLRPGRMRFEYLEPKGKLAIADGRRTFLYLPEDRQALSAPLDPSRTKSGIGLLLEERIDLVSEFAISWDGPGEAGGTRLLRLAPRSTGAEYEFLLIATDVDHLIRALTVVDPLGGRVTYRFEHLMRAATLDAALFHFTAPKGVAVQEAAP